MTRTTHPTTELSFGLDDFRWTADDRLQISGRWFGVRGRRFVRPVLNLRADGRRRRLIALLEHKPWAPAEDEPWTAAFAWRGEHGEITNARLEVAPDVVLDLPAPGKDAAGAVLTPRGKKGARGDDASAAPAAVPPPPAPPPAAAGSGALQALERRIETLERERDADRQAASELLERTRQRAASELARAQEQSTQELASVQRLADASARDLQSTERELVASRDHADAVEHELELHGDVTALRRRAETAEREVVALHERLEQHPPGGRAVLADRSIAPQRRGTDWAALVVGFVAIAVLAILAIAILGLLI